MSKKILGNIKELYISTQDEPFRLSQKELMVDDNGVINDKFYAKDPLRSILISSTDAYSLAKEIDIDLEYGVLGENILIDGTISELNLGDTFYIGEVLFEIAQNCTICKGLSKIDSKLPKLLKDDRGIFIHALKSGSIKKGDNLYIL
jgi:MOSC domain-containing protein YiiM